MSDAGRVVVVAPNWLGDAVMALPSIADLRRHLPSARILVAARRSVADLFRLVPSVDEVITLQWGGTPWRRRGFDEDVRALRAAAVDAALLLPNSFAAAWLIARAGVRQRWGYAADMRGKLLTRAVRRPTGSLHQGAYYQHLIRGLGIEAGPLQPSLVISESAAASARQLLVERGWDRERPLVVLAPGAAYGTAKRWIPSYAAELIANLVRDGRTCVLVGSRADASTTQMIHEGVASGCRSQVIDLAGETSLEMLAATLSVAQACVCNDSGAMHLAAAIGTPLVALFGPTREYETSPLTRAGGRADVLTNPVSCRPCMLRECPIDHRCMTGILPSRVLLSVNRLLTSDLGSDPCGNPGNGI
jgi:heptosyltransferase-2